MIGRRNMSNYTNSALRLLMKAIPLYRFFIKAETFSRDELEAYQLEQLKKVVRYAYDHVPYYRERYREIGFEPGDFRSILDFKKLPYLNKETLRTLPREKFLSDEIGKLSSVDIRTSGTTGTPLSFACDLHARAAKYAITYRAFSLAGYRIGRMQFVLKNCYGAKTAFGYSLLTNRLWMHAYMNTKENCRAADVILRKHPPRHISAHPNALLEFGRSIEDARKTFSKLIGITSMSEPLPQSLREQLEECFGVKVYDFYSNNESSFMAYESSETGYLFGEQFSYPEIDSVGTNPLEGELVTTTFNSFAMPLIRYRNADIVELKRSNEGGSHFLRVARVLGRTAEAIILPDGNKVRFFSFARADLTNVLMYQFEQTAPDKLLVAYVPIDPLLPLDFEGMKNELRFYLGDMMNLEFKQVDTLKKDPSGKIPRTICWIKE